jgi:tetratricopeptide (TPR) repeat protein
MARAQAQRQRKRRAQSHARKSARSAEDLMFFPKLRRRAKWVFLLLAIAFAIGFVAFGVGTGVGGTSIGDVLRDIIGRQSTAGSLDDARKDAAEHPADADAQLAYANALQARGQTRAAIVVLQGYTARKPKDTDALRQLANLWGSVANTAQQEQEAAQAQATQASAAASLAASTSPFLQEVDQNKIAQTLASQASARASAAQARVQQAATSQQQIYEQLTLLLPDDPSVYLSLGIAAQEASDLKSAIAAYEKFLQLAPNDPSAAQVKQQVQFLKQQLKANPLLGQSG